VGKSSSQQDKCQVGNIYTYSGDLVIFPIFFHHSSILSLTDFNCPS
jgi:hypothetical protein